METYVEGSSFNENSTRTVRDFLNTKMAKSRGNVHIVEQQTTTTTNFSKMKEHDLSATADSPSIDYTDPNDTRCLIECSSIEKKPLVDFMKNPQESSRRTFISVLPIKTAGTVRSRAVFTNAIMAAAARVPPAETRPSILKGPTWTIQAPQQPVAPLSSIKTFKKVNMLPTIKTEPSSSSYEPSSSRMIPVQRSVRDPSQISLFNEDPEVKMPEWGVVDNEIPVDAKEFTRIIKGKRKQPLEPVEEPLTDGPIRPGWSYSCLIALALKNSPHGYLTVSEIYAFIMYNFPFFRRAPDGWRNSVRHNLSLNKCFAKVDLEPNDPAANKRCSYWMITPDRMDKVNTDILKWRERNPDPSDACHGLAFPEYVDELVEGTRGMPPLDERQRPIYATAPPGSGSLSVSKSNGSDQRDVLADFLVKTDYSKTFSNGERDTEFSTNQMLFEDSPLMDHMHDESTMDVPTNSVNDVFVVSNFVQRRPSSFFTPLKDETNHPSAVSFRSSTPNIDLDNSHQGRYNQCMGSFDSALCAVNDNSLLVYSPSYHKEPTTFPDEL